MATKKKVIDIDEEGTSKDWQEANLIKTFNLNKIKEYYTPLMQAWLEVENPTFNVAEQSIFDKKLREALRNLEGWSEEDLKMKFITYVLELGLFSDDDGIIGYFDKIISATVENITLKVKSDFMLAKGIMNIPEQPYFHFQEYKPHKKPSGDSMAQLLAAFLIGQAKNDAPKPLYGVEIAGEYWKFVILEGKDYCMSESFSCTKKDDLLKIIAILRKFKLEILPKLMD